MRVTLAVVATGFGVTMACGSRPAPAVSAASSSASATPSAAASASAACPDAMIAIPAGKLAMGAADGDDDEKPVHPVDVPAFCLDRTEVTVAAYTACVRRGACTPAASTVDWPKIGDAERKLWSAFCNAGTDRDTHPINCVDWTQADAFCRANGKRLPTEEEWEYAARGAEARLYPWGDAPPDAKHLNACGSECVSAGKTRGETWAAMYEGHDGFFGTAPVGSFPLGATPLGLVDMAGNVWEWTASVHCDYTDPKKCTTDRVNRGGGWFNDFPPDVQGANRNEAVASYRNRDLGFRCAR
jgi:formylglycine-generating enzyme required for sulfatase activity